MTQTHGITDVGFIGLGSMGAPMAARLIRAGFRVHGCDPAASARAELASVGGDATAELYPAVRDSSVVILMLPDSGVVESVVRDAGFAATAGTIVVDMSSSEPMRTVALGEQLVARDLHLVDAPVSGGTTRAAVGELTIMAGGDPAVITGLDPVLAPLGQVTHVGPLGAGHAIKSLNNLLSATHLLATAEAMVAGERFGLDPAVMLRVFNSSSGRSGSTEAKWPTFILNETYDSGFRLQLMLKDMNIALGLTKQVGAAVSLGADATRWWAEAARSLPPTADHTEIARWVRTLADD